MKKLVLQGQAICFRLGLSARRIGVAALMFALLIGNRLVGGNSFIALVIAAVSLWRKRSSNMMKVHNVAICVNLM